MKVQRSLYKALFSVAAFTMLSFTIVHAQSQNIYFPESDSAWAELVPSEVAWSSERLSSIMSYAQKQNSSGVVILLNGKILAEQYWDIENPSQGYRNFLNGRDQLGHAIEDVASAQKSIAAILVGIAQEKGHIGIDDKVSDYVGVGWSKATAFQEDAITIRHLLSMTSGLTPDLSYEVAPDTKWSYNTPAYHFLMRVLESATGRERNDFTSEWLTIPIGMSNSSWTPRSWSSADIGVGFSTTARDLAKVGILIQSGGFWKGIPILGDADYLREMISPSQALFPSYGYLWLLNGQLSCGPNLTLKDCDNPRPWTPFAPDNTVGMQGAGGRYLFVAPELGLVVSRIGSGPIAEGVAFPSKFWELLMAAKN